MLSTHHVLADIMMMTIRAENINVHKMKAIRERSRAIRANLHPSSMLPAATASRAYNTNAFIYDRRSQACMQTTVYDNKYYAVQQTS